MTSILTISYRRIRLAAAIWARFISVQVRLRRYSLPHVVASLKARRAARPITDPARLGRAIAQTLRLGPFEARCLSSSLVLYWMLREGGEDPELVVGMPDDPTTPEAHAWVELRGQDVGPPPGRGLHRELMRLQ